MKILISHPSSNLNNRNTVLALEKNKMLFKFITSVNFNTNNFYLKLLPKKIIEYLDKRNFSTITKNIITRNLIIEIFNLIKKNYHYLTRLPLKNINSKKISLNIFRWYIKHNTKIFISKIVNKYFK